MTDKLPKMALSIRQPWAWAILHSGKDIENRSWQAVNHGLDQSGRIAIHASGGLGKQEYEDVVSFLAEIGVECPAAIDLPRGGIVGSVEIIDVVKHSNSPWFFGPRGLVLRNAESCDFIPVKGCLGFFNWRDHLTEDIPPSAPWMRPKAPAPDSFHMGDQPSLFEDT